MSNSLSKLYMAVRGLAIREEGQDLVEYALLFTLISLASIGSMSSMATTITGVLKSVIAALG